MSSRRSRRFQIDSNDEEDGEWVGLMTWAAACYALKPRDERIGWNHAMRRLRLKLVVNNRRFCIVAPKGARPNLASQLLGLAIRSKESMSVQVH